MIETLLKILLVEDDPADARLIHRTLLQSDRVRFDLTHVLRLSDALGRLRDETFDVILLDLGLPDSWGPDTFRETHNQASNVPTVILTGLDVQSFAIEAMQMGAQDYLIKGHIDTHVLESSIRYSIERKRLEYETNAAREAALEAKRTTSEFLANMSHEIRTPLNTMIGATSLLMDSPLTSTQQEWMDMVHSSGESLLTLINDILDLSRIEAGRLPIEPIPFNLESVVHEVQEIVAVKAEEKGLQLIVTYPSEVPRSLVGDPGRIRQVLTNLVSNAIKFTHEGRVVMKVESEGPVTEEAHIRMSVEDTGIGIAQDKLEHIFEKFTQAHSESDHQYGGTGLGLAICNQLVELMGGTIEVTSRLGQGSVFRFRLTLPVHAEEPTPEISTEEISEVVARASRRIVNARVLVVEDNVFNQKIATEMLRKLGCRVDMAGNGREAVDMVQTFPYDLVFMDCQMPEMDGYEATAEIRRTEETGAHIPIIAMTANAMQGDRERCLEAGMDDYVSKPVRMEYLTEVLSQYPRTAAPVQEPPAIDKEVFSNLWGILGAHAPELTRSFIDETSTLLSDMKQALDRGDWDGLLKAAHTLKGSSVTIGANRLAEICQQLQALDKSELPGPAGVKLTELEQGFVRVKQELGEMKV
ncbi:MAG: response regulator [Chloroflexi bacterium]|nr:response regulator [Chloroflexota bacterium]